MPEEWSGQDESGTFGEQPLLVTRVAVTPSNFLRPVVYNVLLADRMIPHKNDFRKNSRREKLLEAAVADDFVRVDAYHVSERNSLRLADRLNQAVVKLATSGEAPLVEVLTKGTFDRVLLETAAGSLRLLREFHRKADLVAKNVLYRAVINHTTRYGEAYFGGKADAARIFIDGGTPFTSWWPDLKGEYPSFARTELTGLAMGDTHNPLLSMADHISTALRERPGWGLFDGIHQIQVPAVSVIEGVIQRVLADPIQQTRRIFLAPSLPEPLRRALPLVDGLRQGGEFREGHRFPAGPVSFRPEFDLIVCGEFGGAGENAFLKAAEEVGVPIRKGAEYKDGFLRLADDVEAKAREMSLRSEDQQMIKQSLDLERAAVRAI